MKSEMSEKVRTSISELEAWVESHQYKGYEPFDGLSSYLRPLTRWNLLLDRLLMQLIRQSPINLRPLFGVKPLESTKGRGYMASGYLTMFRITGDRTYVHKAVNCLDWLMENKSPKYSNYTWANNFDYASRGGRYSKQEPIIVWTALIGLVFLDAYNLLKQEKYLRVAMSVCDWILALPREKTNSGTCLSYFAFKRSFVHNSNMLGAAMLAKTGTVVANSEYLHVAKEAMEYSCSRQLPSGAWYYGEEPHYQWIDNFHTGYNLDSLHSYIEDTGEKAYERILHRGFEFFIKNFFEEDGRPKYYHDRAYPIDSQCISQSIETLAKFTEFDKGSLELAVKVARWAIEHMQDTTGYFYYRQYPLMKAKAPMFHWAQATTYRALAILLSRTVNQPI
jgi:rhamnogalacturonyl hydrolase YesR